MEGAEGAAVVGEPEKCNTVTFVGADGMEQSFPLDFLLERGAIVANRVNGEDIMSVMGATNQLWVPGLPAKYFVRDIREIRFTNEEVPPVIGPFVDDGHDYTNRPNVAAKAEYVGRVGEPMEFTGWAHDFDKRIIAVEAEDGYLVLFNPVILKKSGQYEAEEGCLSLEGVRKTKRWQSIKVQYQTMDGKLRIKTFTGWTAQIIQHEIDHCDGILI